MTEQTRPAPIGRPRRATHRNIRERWVITGQIILETPAHFGTGEAGDLTDMPVLLDETDGTPLLPGTSIAGALRNYLREFERGDGVPLPVRPRGLSEEEAKKIYKIEQKKERDLAATLLFGGYRGDDEGEQSPLVIHDALGTARDYELRDSVAIDPETRTAAEDKKFDIQLLAAGTTFDLRFEMIAGVPRKPKTNEDDWDPEQDYWKHRQNLLNTLAIALRGFEQGEIHMGARKRRGYGKCRVSRWTARHYDLTQTEGLLAWLVSDRGTGEDYWYTPVQSDSGDNIARLLRATTDFIEDARQRVRLTATFAVDGSLLIRSGFGEADSGPDMVHLHSSRVGKEKPVPIIPGTSWAGVLRHRANRIARTASGGDAKAIQPFIDRIFGPSEIKHGDRNTYASRLLVAESVIEGGQSLVQTRVKIDRFTGGAYETALFSEQPLYGSNDCTLTLDLTLRAPPSDAPQSIDAEVGLLLLLLKDLWTGDLPVGGESSVGRGRLKGLEANLEIDSKTWAFKCKDDGGLDVEGNRGTLQEFVDVFNDEIKRRTVKDG